MSTPADWSAEDFAAKLKERSRARRADTVELPPERLRFRQAAALMTVFDPRQLRTPAGDRVGGAVLHLVEDATSISGQGVTTWKLRSNVRTEALRSLRGPDEARDCLEANLDLLRTPSTARFALDLLRGDLPDLDMLDSTDLGRIRRAVSWLREVPGTRGLPEEQEIERLLDRSRLLEPLRALLLQPFEGRRAELGRLQDHVGLVTAPTFKRRLARAGRSISDWRGRPQEEYPLVVHGPGGIGKSTLLARSLLDHVTDPSLERFPFVYVDSERATVWLNEPMSLVAEMARQLSVQYPAASEELIALSASARVRGREQRSRMEDLGDLKDVTTTRSIGRAASQEYHVVARDTDSNLIHELGAILHRAVSSGGSTAQIPPFVVALDSFEEAQYRASPVLDRMWAMLGALRSAYPRTRVIVAGRAPVGHPSIDTDEIPTLELGELDPAAAERFLVDRGLSQPLARAVIERVGGNPLSLQLAAKVAEAHRQTFPDTDPEHGDRWIEEVPAKRRRFFGAVDDMLIQGMLYDRLLMHITNPEVRQLAHPGLVLRRITPDLIRVVLGPHCDVDMSDPDKPAELFEELARELDLVDRVAPAVLRHRSDVRKVMLRLLAADKARPVREVERAAIAFYAGSDAPEDRAEELYHRLRIGERLSEVKQRWLPEAGIYLLGAEDELPARSARLLNRLLQGTPDTVATDDQYEWEQHTAIEVENLLTQGFPEQVLTVLGQRSGWTVCSPLHALRAEALLQTDRATEARASIAAALHAEGIEECGDSYLELLLLSARLSAEAGDLAAADDDLEVAERTARHLGNDLDALGVLLTRAQLHDAASAPDDPAVEEALVARVEALPDDLLASRPALLRAVAAEVGAHAPAVLAHAVQLVGLPALSGGRLTNLAKAIFESSSDPAVTKTLAAVADDDPARWSRAGLHDVENLLASTTSTGRLDEMAKHLLVIDDPSGVLRQGIAAAMDEVAPHG